MRLWFGVLSTAILMSSSAMADDFSRTDIESIIKDYILNNPQVILDSVETYSQSQQHMAAEQQQEEIKKNIDWLENNDMLPVAGNPNGDVTVVEFFDYNCGYCKKALDDVLTLIEEDKNVRLVLVDMPILGRTSEVAARWAMAARKQDAYLPFHIAVMKHNGAINELTLADIAEKMDLDVDQMRVDADSDEVRAKISEKSQKAAQMGIGGTPAFVIGGKLFGGYIGLDRMREAVKSAREDANEPS